VVLLVLEECVSELLAKHGLFLPRFETVSSHHQAKAHDTSPLADYHYRTEGGENESGIDGMAQVRVGSGANKLMALLDRDPCTPIFRQVITSPDSQPNPSPCADHSQNRANQTMRNKSFPPRNPIPNERWNISR